MLRQPHYPSLVIVTKTQIWLEKELRGLGCPEASNAMIHINQKWTIILNTPSQDPAAKVADHISFLLPQMVVKLGRVVNWVGAGRDHAWVFTLQTYPLGGSYID